jgi:glucuronoarabinoxylan endo-1,4-beta-xylanase
LPGISPPLNDLTGEGTPFYYALAQGKGKDVWMTEHYLTPTASATAQPGITDALSAAREINDSMTVGNWNTYIWWWAADWDPGSGVINYGLVDSSNHPTYYGFAMADFAKFVRSGYVGCNATASPTAKV